MVPSGEGAAFEMVESKLALEVLVHPLGAPALLEDPDDLLATHASRQCGEREFRGFLLAVEPLSNEPERLSISNGAPVIVCGLHADEAEARAEFRLRAVAPGDLPECLASECNSEIKHSGRLAAGPTETVEPHHLHVR